MRQTPLRKAPEIVTAWLSVSSLFPMAKILGIVQQELGMAPFDQGMHGLSRLLKTSFPIFLRR